MTINELEKQIINCEKCKRLVEFREKIAKARMTSPKTQENEPDVSFGGSGASATNPRGRGGY